MITTESFDSWADEKLIFFLEATPDAIVIADEEGRMVAFNQHLCDMFGYSRKELLELEDKKVDLLMPGRFPEIFRIGELIGTRKDASQFPLEVNFGAFSIAHEKLIISTIRDITSRKPLEVKFQGLLESAPDGIVVVDTNGLIAIVNSQAEKLFDYSKKELLGKPIEILVPERFKIDHIKFRNEYMANPHTRPMGGGLLLTGRKKTGSEFPVEISLSPLETEQGMLVTSIIRDITDRRQAEEKIEENLREKEILLKEIHHRVKNNLQITSSLLRLQSENIKDEFVKELFIEGENRIRSMALVHEKLYQSRDLSKINLIDYIETLAQLLFRAYSIDTNKIKLKIMGNGFFLSIDAAIPCGLIINELISNCLKHAFPHKKEGEVRINIEGVKDDGITLLVADNGVGLPIDFNFDKLSSLGLQLVQTLVKQLNGTMEIKNIGGVEFKISFSEGIIKK